MEEYEIPDFPCFHDDATLCSACRKRLESMQIRATELRDKDRAWSLSDGTVAKLKLIQDQSIEVTQWETDRRAGKPSPPFPDCDLCGEGGCLITPAPGASEDWRHNRTEQMVFCAPCWRAHRAFKESLLKLDKAEAQALKEPES